EPSPRHLVRLDLALLHHVADLPDGLAEARRCLFKGKIHGCWECHSAGEARAMTEEERPDQQSTDQGWRRGPRTQRKPMLLCRSSAKSLCRRADRRKLGPKKKEPPRSTRSPPAGIVMLGLL